MRLSVFLFMGLLSLGFSFKFEESGDAGVEFGEKTSTAQIIRMDESNDKNKTVRFVLVTEIDVNSVTLTTDSDADPLKIKTEKISDTSIYLSCNRLDYEVYHDEAFIIKIREHEDVEAEQTISLTINNLDDESPTLTVSACNIVENTTASFDNTDTFCEFTISDNDGFLDEMTFNVLSGTHDESTLFDLQYHPTPEHENVYEAPVYLTLKDGQILDFEKTNLYIFKVTAKDSGNNTLYPVSDVPVIVKVDDVPDEPPSWDSNFKAAMTIREEEEINIKVSASDGDVEINNPIVYSIIDTTFAGITVDKNGLILIPAIDRDAGNDQVTFTVLACEEPDPDSCTEGKINLIIEDIDDNVAVIDTTPADAGETKSTEITVDEGATDLPLTITAYDKDLGENALFNSILQSDSNNYEKAFSIIPSQGYQKTSLILTVIDSTLLDYETKEWRNIKLELLTKGKKNSDMTDVWSITINLNDINDESPKFPSDKTEFFASVLEDVEEGYLVTNIKATDADAEDEFLNHTLASRILTIEQFGGDITTTTPDAFDYEKQQEVFAQIVATDAVGHTATAQLTISVIDVNDEKPRLVVSSAISIKENQKDGYLIDADITASDVDTTSSLEFSINWDNSYATKSSQRVKDEIFAEFRQCITVDTVSDEIQSTAKLSIKETKKDNTPDFEIFDNLYINLIVTDLNTDPKHLDASTDSAMIVIAILDENDNAPIFPKNTDSVKRSVMENSVDGTTITTVVATDDDVGTQLNYTIESADSETPLWVAIDETTGVVTVSVSDDEALDCDDPKRDNLKYKVTAHDGDPTHDASVIITIDIIDQNENSPTMDDQSITQPELENGDKSHNGDVFLKLNPNDIDRDEAYHTVICTFSPSTSLDVTNRFKIENNLVILDLQDNINLDRDEIESFSFELNCKDDPTRQGFVQNAIDPAPTVIITLTDINDNAPTIKNLDATTVRENVQKGSITTLQGEDKDKDDNGLIGVATITSIQRFLDKNDKTTKQDDPPQDLFGLSIKDDNQIDLILTSASLRDFYGYLKLSVKLTDKGTPSQSNEVDVGINVEKYNFESPQFVGDFFDNPIYLQTVQTKNSPLIQYDGETTLPNINATDQQNNKFYIIFEVIGGTGEDIFKISNLGNSLGQLQIKTNDFDPQPYTVEIKASIDGTPEGNAATSITKTINVNFIDVNTDPIFDDHEGSVKFKENEKNLTNVFGKAHYDLPEVPPSLGIYYLLVQGNKNLFSVSKTTDDQAMLTLLDALDYENETQYTILIQSSNKQSLNPNAIDQTKFTLTVDVIDVNDNAPQFIRNEYIGILLVSGAQNVVVATVEATDIDTTSYGKLRYSVTKYVGSDASLHNIPDSGAFIADTSGDIRANFKLLNTYKGYFNITVTVYDEDELSDTTEVRVYLVTDSNLVEFSFANDQTTVANATDKIKEVLDNNFEGYITTVQNPKADQSDEVNTVKTISPTYFLDLTTSEPIESTEIKKKVVSVSFFNKLKNDFASVGLTLLSFEADNTSTENLEATLKAWLIGVAVVLGALCLILLIAFILKTRSLNQRIDKLSNTKFGSQESGLNRTGVTAPTTNKHAVEGSNPVYNNEVDTKDIDRRISVTSGDSDLIGVEDDEKFNYEYPTKDEEIN